MRDLEGLEGSENRLRVCGLRGVKTQSDLDLARSADCPQRPRIASSASVLQRRPTAKDSAPRDRCGTERLSEPRALLPFENERPRDAADAFDDHLAHTEMPACT